MAPDKPTGSTSAHCKRVLVCGGRKYDDVVRLTDVLNDIHRTRGPITHLIHGDASGADRLAGTFGRMAGLRVIAFPADWVTHGVAAGPIRNQQMIDEGNPDLVVAFPGGGGTKDMVRRARKAGVEVIEVPT